MFSSLGIGFVLGWIGSMPIAGAVSIFVFQRGLAGRLRDGLLLASGAALAEALWCAGVRTGADRILDRWPEVGPVAQILGASMLLGLGLYFLRLRNRVPEADPNVEVLTVVREMGLGFAVVACNPAIPINWLAMLTVIYSLGINPFEGPVGSFAAGVALGIMGWFTLMLILLDHFRSRLADGTLSLIMKVMGVLLAAAGVFALIRLFL